MRAMTAMRSGLALGMLSVLVGCGSEQAVSTPDASVGCSAAELMCGDACVDPQKDTQHCGGCDRACPAGEQCLTGHCTSDATGALTIANAGPESGYQNGGTWITLTGTGFTNPLRAFIGDGRAPATAIDATHVRLLSPPGLLGMSDVHVEIGGKRATLPRGFRYDTFGLSSTWTKVMMSQARGGRPGVAVLQNGQVLIYGGTADSTSASASNTADLYNPTTKKTTLVPSTLVTPRFDTSAVTLLDGRALIVGACNVPTGHPACPLGDGTIADLYDPKTNTFVAAPPKLADPARIAAKPTLLCDGRVLITSGNRPTAEVFDPSTDTFTALPITSANTGFGMPVRLRDCRVLLAAPSGGKSEIYDPDSGLLITLDTTFLHSVTSLRVLPNGRAIAAGGGDLIGDDLTPHAAVQTFDPKTNTFSMLSVTLETARTGFATVLASNGSLLVAGGQSSTYGLSTTGCDHVFPLLDSVEVIDPVAQTRSQVAKLPEPNFELIGVSLFDGSLILAGGSQCGGAVAIPFVYYLESAPVL